MKTVEKQSTSPSGPWPLAYLRLQRIVLTALERGLPPLQPDDPELHAMWMVLHFLVHQATAETAQNAVQFYRTLALLVTRAASHTWESDCPSDLMRSTLLIPLKKVTGYTLNAYEAFGYNFMSLPLLNSVAPPAIFDKFRDELADAINYKILAHAMSSWLKTSAMQSQAALATTTDRVRFLSCFIYFHRFAHNFHSPEAYSAHKDFVAVVSVILNTLPAGLMDVSAEQGEETGDVNPFIREQILSLINQEGIGNLLSGSTVSSDSSEEDRVEEARELANYALALLRFFPRKGDDIRMWLYLGPSTDKSSRRSMPAIKYFWEASKRSSVFTTIARDSRAAIELLKPKAESSSDGIVRGSFWQAPEQQTNQRAITADEWRVILVFLELYTFILKLMDDEEFFSGSNDPLSDKVRDNNLPLADIKELTTFLKNLGFTLYFNASDIADAEERDTSSGGLSFYNPKVAEAQAQKVSAEPSIGGVAGLSLDYVKGLVTGLVRSLYERDSRRKFLPANHWLMTSRFDMTGFIPSVVQEEESRHRIEEEDAEDRDDEEPEEDDFDDTPQLIGTSRTQHQRRLEKLQRQQRKASRRRYLQAVAPRLEILQNMPFFIPFATRVQIFRQFVNLDMVSCSSHGRCIVPNVRRRNEEAAIPSPGDGESCSIPTLTNNSPSTLREFDESTNLRMPLSNFTTWVQG
jgi:ubiquitin-protein ligase E3 C